MITDNKKLKIVFMLFSLLCLTAVGVCLICDFAVNKGVTWSAYVISSVLFAWLVFTPLIMVKRGKILSSLIMLTAAVLPFIYVLERITPLHGWYMPLGVPIGVTCILAVWLTYIIVRYVKINLWYMLAAIIFLYGVVVSVVVRYFTSAYLGIGMLTLNNVINVFSSIVIVVLLAIIGYGKSKSE